MGTNFYLRTIVQPYETVLDYSRRCNKLVEEYGYSSEVVNIEPYFCCEWHIAKTSAGWLPLFQAHDKIKSVADIKTAYQTHNFAIVDEYNTEYTWEEFTERVLKFNGGVLGGIPCEKVDIPKLGETHYNPTDDGYRPISHMQYIHKQSRYYDSYVNSYYTDPEGYEFCTTWFS